MIKLQLYITMSQNTNGFQSMVEINPDEYAKGWVCDLRPVVRQVEYQVSQKEIFYMVKYIDQGMFITVIRTIPKTPGNHLAAWIYIPYSLRISDKDIKDIVAFITNKVSSSEVKPKDISEMRNIFGTEYNEDLNAPIFAPSEGTSYAYRYYGPRTGVSFNDLIGPFRFQTCYLPFAGVLLVDQDITSDIAGTNLTSAPLDDMAVVLPPPHNQDTGFKPTIYGQDFDTPFFVPMSRNVDIIWHKESYEDIKQTIYVAQSEMRAPSLQQTHPSIVNTRLMQKQHADANDAAQQKEEKPKHEDNNSRIFIISDDDQQNNDNDDRIEVTIEETDTPPVQPAKHVYTKPQVKTDLPHRKNVYRFQIPSKSASFGSMIEFEIDTDSEITSSPIEGYEPTGNIVEGSGRINNLIYKGGESSTKSLINKAIYAGAGLLAGILLSLLFTCGGNEKKDASQDSTQANIENTQASSDATAPQDAANASAAESANANSQQAAQAPAATADAQHSLEEAIKYLDSNDIWERSEMEAFPDLKGLYDDMNNINRKKIVEVWGPKLQESRKFTSLVVHHSKLSMKKKERKNPYNEPNDTKISVQRYLNTIDP